MTDLVEAVINAISIGGLYALAATGIALIYGVMRLMNFAHGEVILVSAYSVLIFVGLPWPVLAVATIAVGVVVAMGIERVAYRPVRQASGDTLLVTSFAVAACLQNIVILVAGSRPKSVSIFPGLDQSANIVGVSVVRIDMLTIAVTIAVLIGLTMLLSHTRIGIQLRAASENFTMARLLAVKADRTILFAFAVSGVLAAITALLLIARTGNLYPQLGLNLIVYGFVATIIGGMGSVRGAVIGGFILGALQIGLQEGLPEGVRPYRDAFVFGVVILILLLRPQGLLPSRLSEVRV